MATEPRDVARAGLWTGALLALAPFELREWTLGVGGLKVTLVEALALLAALQNLWALRHGWRRRLSDMARPVFIALAAWTLLNIASAAWSGQAINSLKFALRTAGGVWLCLSCAALAGSGSYRRALSRGVLVSLAGLTVFASCERLIGQPFERVLLHFRDEPTWMLGEPRLSTVFYHANTLAAFLELTIPLLLLTAAQAQGRRRWMLLLWLALTGIMLSLTYSRAGLGAGVLGALILAVALRGGDRRRIYALAFALFLCVAYFGNPDMRARLGGAERTYKVAYEFLEPCQGRPGEVVRVPVRVKNIGQWPLSDRHAPGELGWVIWPPTGRPPASHFSYHPLRPLTTGQHQDVLTEVRLPNTPGKHALVVDVRRKAVIWLSAAGAKLGGVLCDASEDATTPTRDYRPTESIKMQTRPLELSRLHYWRAALELFSERPWLGHGADQFRWQYRSQVPDRAWDPRARAHSVLMETAADLGLLGLIVLGALIALIALNMLQNLRRASALHYTQLAATVGCCAFAAHSVVDYFLAYTQILLVAWPMLGLTLCSADEHAAEPKIS